MSNKKLRITINNNETSNSYDVLGNFNNNLFKYLEPNTNTEVLFDVINQELTRSNEELEMTYNFSKELGNIYIKELKKELEVTIKVLEKIIEKDKVSIKYLIEEDTFNYIIEVKE